MPRLNPDTRNPAHFRVMRETLGISVSDLANTLDVNPRSVRDWCFSTTAPDAAWDIIDNHTTAARFLAQVRGVKFGDEIGAVMDELADQPDPDEVVLSVYATDQQARQAGLDMPAHEHRACIGILALCLMAEGYAVDISYVPRDTV